MWRIPRINDEDYSKVQSKLKEIKNWVEEVDKLNIDFEKKYCSKCRHHREDGGFDCIDMENPCPLSELENISSRLDDLPE